MEDRPSSGAKAQKGQFSSAYSLTGGEETRQHYASWAKTYDQEIGDEGEYAQPARAAAMLAKYQPDQTISILDAGCGSGLSGVALRTAGYPNIDGCDFSPEMLEQAAHKKAYRNLFECDLNAGLTNIGDDTYDCIACVGVFSFGHVSPDACDEFLRVLKPDGHLIIALNEQFWEKGDLETKLNALVDAKRAKLLDKEYGEHLPSHNVKGWVLALQKTP